MPGQPTTLAAQEAPSSSSQNKPIGFATTVRSGNRITYGGGAVLFRPTTIYYIWYGNWDGNGAVQILEDFALNLGFSPYWRINTLYDDQFGGHVSSQIQFGGSTMVGYPQGNNVSDIPALLNSVISQGALPRDPDGIYVVLTSADVGEGTAFRFCDDYCGYHAAEESNLKYAFIGDPAHCVPPVTTHSCFYTTPGPNNDRSADTMASHIAHELSETVTDPYGDAWYTHGVIGTTPEAGENADQCVGLFGLTYYTDENGSQANVRLGFRNYLLQQNWVPIAGGYCGLSSEEQAISIGSNHTVAVQTDGSLWAWGKNDRGQLGIAGGDRFTPTRISAGAPGALWTSVAAGNRFSLALRSDHTLWGWGDQSQGQLGNGISSVIQSTPRQIGGQEWAAVRAGNQFAVAIKTDGTLWSWGYNANGQLGVGDQIIHAFPTQEALQLGPPWYAPWSHITAGSAHTLATTADGSPYAWGWNDWGTLGVGDTNPRLTPSPLSEFSPTGYLISAGNDFSLSVDRFGGIWSWGRNQYGQIAAPSSYSYTADPSEWLSEYDRWQAISAGSRHGMAVRTDGTLWTWGSNSNGQLGTGVALGTSFAPATQESTRAASWIATYAGQDTSIAARVDGSVYGWGNNSSGQFGLGNTTSRSTPAILTWTLSPPVVELTVDNLSINSFHQGAPIAGSASVAGGRITKVEFYYGNTLISTDATGPNYTFSWNTTNVPAGTYQLRARAYNALGQSTYSAPITVRLAKVLIAYATPASPVNLTTDGSIDWVHYGLKDATTVEKKKDITNHPLAVYYVQEQNLNNFVRDTANTVSINWTDGSPDLKPNVNGSPTTAGVKPAIQTSGTDGYSVTADGVPGGDRVVSLYFKNVNADVNLSFKVDGAEATATWANNNKGTAYRVYRITYRPADINNDTLRGNITFGSVGAGGTLTFLGATLH